MLKSWRQGVAVGFEITKQMAVDVRNEMVRKNEKAAVEAINDLISTLADDTTLMVAVDGMAE